jgi:valyl-tRNA synthetase
MALPVGNESGEEMGDKLMGAFNGSAPGYAEIALRESVPFREVYIHSLVRDAERQKMSKTKGNVLDPIQVIEKYGTDATRFTLAAMSSPGTDIAFNESRTEGYRAFANKIWNAARFMFMNVDRIDPALRPASTDKAGCSRPGVAGFHAGTLEDRWILSRFNSVACAVNESLPTYRFDEAANAIYDFFWGEFCDWYIELIKPRLLEGAEGAQLACANLVALFEVSLRLLHPIMPFITDEIWHAIYEGKPPQKSLALATYPQADEKQIDKAAETQMAILQDLIISIRNLRAELKVETKAKVPVEVFVQQADIRKVIEENRSALGKLANVEEIRFAESSLEKLSTVRHTARFDVRLVYEKKIDVAAEREKLTKELEKLDNEKASAERQLGDEQFVAKAPAKVVEQRRRRLEEVSMLIEKLRKKLDELE